mmetsp:Transcript_56435/g.129569  ORF Transcript_56435/g.129569 Transcript_56435/m.129569 type:complete len:86 (-) Transcript_56435:1216-1473(-)
MGTPQKPRSLSLRLECRTKLAKHKDRDTSVSAPLQAPIHASRDLRSRIQSQAGAQSLRKGENRFLRIERQDNRELTEDALDFARM